ncbi:uncharacterized protein LOC143441687 [Arvicanthis niloticus]|uniref:uncharacterized protein LOC143311918 n=1 Tax=Arvicanthis niloticus TaxID=61156 RepID=UPI00402B9CCE
MATTSPRGASGYSYSCSERRCAGRTPPPCSGKTWATLARRPRLRRPASLAPGAPHAHPPARGHLLGPAAVQPRAPSRRRPGSSRWPRPLRPGAARLPRRLRLARLEPQPGAALLVLPPSALRFPSAPGLRRRARRRRSW